MKTVIVSALSAELGDHFKDLPVYFSGIGKINAARVAMKAILMEKPDLVVNLGTAGSFDRKPGSLLSCVQFVQGDMHCEGLGWPGGHTPFEDKILQRIEIPQRAPWLERARCITQDRFVDKPHDPEPGIPEVLDMEAYAIAKVCFFEEIPFVCIKYVSDDGGGGAREQWESSLARAAKMLRLAYDQLLEVTALCKAPKS